jgi:hypothetical protein
MLNSILNYSFHFLEQAEEKVCDAGIIRAFLILDPVKHTM